MSKRCIWQSVTAQTPSGKTRVVQQCAACGRVKFRHHGAMRYINKDGSVNESRTVDESWCTHAK